MAEPEAPNKNKLRLVVLHGEDVEDGPKDGGGGGGDSGAPVGERERAFCSDDMLADALSKRLGPDWRVVTESGEWYRWTGQRWEVDRTKDVWNRSREVCGEISAQVDTQKLARDVSSATRIYAAVKLAGTDRRHVTAPEDFDHDDSLINTPLGIIDLATGQQRDHERDAMMTRMTAAGADGECPKFRAFLREATGGDEAMQRFLQRLAGYCLTGSIEEHAIFFFYGPGGTGKTVFLNVLSELLADYATVAPMDLFTISKGERHPAELAILHRARLVTASETDEGNRWDEAKLKAITGGDLITARFMRGNFFTFRPNFKLVLAGNHRPRMRSADDAMRRRFHVIPFKVKPKAPNKALLEELRAELGGILKWAVEGELERRRIGLAPPRGVVEATDEYFEAENTIGRWMTERCVAEPQRTALTRDLYRDFKSWAARTGEFAPSERVFSQKLEQVSGVGRWRDPETRDRGFQGVSLAVQTENLFGTRSPPPARGEVVLGPTDDPGDDYPR